MSEVLIGVIGIGVALILMFLGIPVAFSLILVGFLGFLYIAGSLSGALTLIASTPFNFLFSISFITIPLFVFMGAIVSNSAIGERLFLTVYKWVGQWRGGLAMATIAGCALFASVSGSSAASAATMCRLAYPEMEKYHYKPSLSTGVIATGGTLGVLIPPSVPFIIYAVLTEESIGKLFIAGIIPGVIQAFLLMLVVIIWTRLNPSEGPATNLKTNFKEKLSSLSGTAEVIVLFLIVIGGMFLGFFTANEAAAVGAFGAIIIALIRKMLTREMFLKSLSETVGITGMLTMVMAGGAIFSGFMAVSRLPFELADFVTELNMSPYLVLLVICFIYLITGAVMEMTSVLIITIPIFYQLIVAIGFDPIWFGVTIVILIEISMITPPIGLNVWVISGMLPKVPLGQIFKGANVILIGSVISLILIIALPQIVLFLPNLMR